jgi:hypothetical protein
MEEERGNDDMYRVICSCIDRGTERDSFDEWKQLEHASVFAMFANDDDKFGANPPWMMQSTALNAISDIPELLDIIRRVHMFAVSIKVMIPSMGWLSVRQEFGRRMRKTIVYLKSPTLFTHRYEKVATFTNTRVRIHFCKYDKVVWYLDGHPQKTAVSFDPTNKGVHLGFSVHKILERKSDPYKKSTLSFSWGRMCIMPEKKYGVNAYGHPTYTISLSKRDCEKMSEPTYHDFPAIHRLRAVVTCSEFGSVHGVELQCNLSGQVLYIWIPDPSPPPVRKTGAVLPYFPPAPFDPMFEKEVLRMDGRRKHSPFGSSKSRVSKKSHELMERYMARLREVDYRPYLIGTILLCRVLENMMTAGTNGEVALFAKMPAFHLVDTDGSAIKMRTIIPRESELDLNYYGWEKAKVGAKWEGVSYIPSLARFAYEVWRRGKFTIDDAEEVAMTVALIAPMEYVHISPAKIMFGVESTEHVRDLQREWNATAMQIRDEIVNG